MQIVIEVLIRGVIKGNEVRTDIDHKNRSQQIKEDFPAMAWKSSLLAAL